MRTYCYETSFEVTLTKRVLVSIEYTFTPGCETHMGSMNYAGHPAEPAELEFSEVDINTTDTDVKTAKAENYFPAPNWLVEILSNDDDLYQEICGSHYDADDEYERD